jgi:hypothetical protein
MEAPLLDLAALTSPCTAPERERKFTNGARLMIKVRQQVPGKPDLFFPGTLYSERESEATVNVHWHVANLAMEKKRKGNKQPTFEKGDAVSFVLDDDFTVAAKFVEAHKLHGKCTLRTVWPIEQLELAPPTKSASKRQRDGAQADSVGSVRASVGDVGEILKVVVVSSADLGPKPGAHEVVELVHTLAAYIAPLQTNETHVLLLDGFGYEQLMALFSEAQDPRLAGFRFTSCQLPSPVSFADIKKLLGKQDASICLAHSPATPVAQSISTTDMAKSDDSWATRWAASEAAKPAAASPARSTTTTEPDDSDTDRTAPAPVPAPVPAPARADFAEVVDLTEDVDLTYDEPAKRARTDSGPVCIVLDD